MHKRTSAATVNVEHSSDFCAPRTDQATAEFDDHPLAFSDSPISVLLREALPVGDPRCTIQALIAAGVHLDQMRQWGVALTTEIVAKVIDDVSTPSRSPFTSHIRPNAPEEAGAVPVVYYMRLGNRVKIGFSTNLKARLSAIQPEELLAYERGNVDLERLRHVQFRDLRVSGEWFCLEAPLIDHIAALPTIRPAAA